MTRPLPRIPAAVLLGAALAALAAGCGAAKRAPAPTRPVIRLAGTSASAQAVADAAAQKPTGAGARSELVPLPARAFDAPVARYRAYAGRQADAMPRAVARLDAALRQGDRSAAQAAWLDAYARYLRLGAAYGALGPLDEAIDGTPGDLAGGVRDPRFSGLHRIEYGLWRGAPPATLLPWTERLAGDVTRLRRVVRTVAIPPLDYATRAHEILEDAQRDMLSGRAAPWSGAGLLATAASLDATEAVIGTLRPLLDGRGDALAPVQTDMAQLTRALAVVRRAHGGAWPPLRAEPGGARARRRRARRAAGGARRRPRLARDDADAGDPHDQGAGQMSLDRRAFLLRSAATLGAGGLLGAAEAHAAEAPSPDGADPGLDVRIPFDGDHQAGIITPAPEQATFVALDAIAPDRSTLAIGLQALSSRARELTQGSTIPARLEVDDPPVDSGTLGTTIAPDALTVTIAFGASLFDDRYGLARRRPAGLTRMEPFPHDDLDPAQCHGDVLLQVCAQHRDTVAHAVRELLRPVRGAFALRWTIDGFQGAHRGPTADSSRRNLFGFRDGTGNPDVGDADLMRRLLWVGAGGGAQAWTAGGTYQVLRTIRMHVEFWDRVGLREQENMIGRTRDSGAPLGGTDEYEDPRYALDPSGVRIPLDAHIRRSNPRTQATAEQRILRRGYNFHRGFDSAGQLDMGLVFVAFNQDVGRQFATIQRRLDDEPMIDYVTPVGGGYFFAPRGARGAADWVGSGLFA